MRRIDAKMSRHPAPVFGNRVRIVLRADAAVKRCVDSSGDAAQPGEKSMGLGPERQECLRAAASRFAASWRCGLEAGWAKARLGHRERLEEPRHVRSAPEPWPPPARRREGGIDGGRLTPAGMAPQLRSAFMDTETGQPFALRRGAMELGAGRPRRPAEGGKIDMRGEVGLARLAPGSTKRCRFTACKVSPSPACRSRSR